MHARLTFAVLTACTLALVGCSAEASSAPAPTGSSGTPEPASTPSSTPEPTITPVVPLTAEEQFMAQLPRAAPTLAGPIASAPAAVFIDWGYGQCELLATEGSQGLFQHLIAAVTAGGEEEDRKQAFQEEIAVTETAVSFLCPDQAPAFAEFISQAEAFGEP